MSVQKRMIRAYMNLFSRVGRYDPTWEGYVRANQAATEEEKRKALLGVSEKRYQESKKETRLEDYFKTDMMQLFEGKDVLEIGSNNGGAARAYSELYKMKSITGIEITDRAAEISNLFFERFSGAAEYRFLKAFAEDLPFEDSSFDAIISFDVLEHVADLNAVMNECYRVLRPGGTMLLVFPSYYQPVGHHLNAVTAAPGIQWVFNPNAIMDVYWDILDENPEYRDNMDIQRRPLEPWEKLFIINGTTLRGFRKVISGQPWSEKQQIRFPFGSGGSTVNKRPYLKVLKYVFWLGTLFPVIEEVSNQRVVYILRK